MKNKAIYLFVLLLLSSGIIAQSSQNNISKELEKQKSLGYDVELIDLLSPQATRSLLSVSIDKEVSSADFYDLKEAEFYKLKNNPSQLITLELPTKSHGNIVLEL